MLISLFVCFGRKSVIKVFQIYSVHPRTVTKTRTEKFLLIKRDVCGSCVVVTNKCYMSCVFR